MINSKSNINNSSNNTWCPNYANESGPLRMQMSRIVETIQTNTIQTIREREKRRLFAVVRRRVRHLICICRIDGKSERMQMRRRRDASSNGAVP